MRQLFPKGNNQKNLLYSPMQSLVIWRGKLL